MRDRYFLEADSSLITFEFISVGIKGRVELTIQYSSTNMENIYNLGFGVIEHNFRHY